MIIVSLYVDIEKKLGNFHLNVKFEAKDETLTLLGASGCGKSMTLKCIAGIEKPDTGKIVLNERTLFDSKEEINLTPQQRNIGFMFQNYALFPNMTVFENIKAGTVREKDKKNRKARTYDAIERFHLSGLENHYPSQLSGGQQQRMALARILVSNPEILLLDEPFSALDSHLRFQLEQEIRNVIRDFGKTVILVSHNRDEIFRMTDSIAIIHNGHVETSGSKEHVFSTPKTPYSAALVGYKNISKIEKIDDTHVYASDWGITLALPHIPENMHSIAIKMCNITTELSDNISNFRVIEEVENSFSYTLSLLPDQAGISSPIFWETDKKTWEHIRNESVKLSLPSSKLLPLS